MPTREQIQNLHRNRGKMNPAQLGQARDALHDGHDSIITHADLVAKLPSMEKMDRRTLYAQLDAESSKYPFMVNHADPLLGGPYLALRAKMEHFRGIARDRNGKIILTPDQRKQKIEYLQGRIAEMIGPNADLSQTWGSKVEGIKAEIAYQQAFLDGTSENVGSILDVVAEFGKDDGMSIVKAEG